MINQHKPNIIELPNHLFEAHKWISASGEWSEAIEHPEAYSKEAHLNAIENGVFDVSESDLLEVIEWNLNSLRH